MTLRNPEIDSQVSGSTTASRIHMWVAAELCTPPEFLKKLNRMSLEQGCQTCGPDMSHAGHVHLGFSEGKKLQYIT